MTLLLPSRFLSTFFAFFGFFAFFVVNAFRLPHATEQLR